MSIIHTLHGNIHTQGLFWQINEAQNHRYIYTYTVCRRETNALRSLLKISVWDFHANWSTGNHAM
uniref:Uncharacterized protein n=1 Tax=Anguilla anguilla TaxID=7936 RepID=A0A0E9R7V0_ANGAN